MADSVTDTRGANRMAAAGKPEMLTNGAFDREFAQVQMKAHEEAESPEASLKKEINAEPSLGFAVISPARFPGLA